MKKTNARKKILGIFALIIGYVFSQIEINLLKQNAKPVHSQKE